MKTRAWIGSFLWVFGFNLLVAWAAIDWGLGWAIAILCLRHILAGIPKLYNTWRELVVGPQDAAKMPALSVEKWPNRKWLIETVLCSGLSAVVVFWFNYPLKELFLAR
ncbi:MAG: hypothetical protein KA928_02130 [Longilinea sp.]|jgi:hypothetical protein|nr:hypothetical protein [Longilinea sp.]